MKGYCLHPEAEAEFLDALQYIKSQRKGWEKRLRKLTREAISLIRKVPEAFAMIPGRSARRFVIRGFPYSIIYRIENNEIQIVAFAHGSRHPDYWIQRRT